MLLVCCKGRWSSLWLACCGPAYWNRCFLLHSSMVLGLHWREQNLAKRCWNMRKSVERGSEKKIMNYKIPTLEKNLVDHLVSYWPRVLIHVALTWESFNFVMSCCHCNCPDMGPRKEIWCNVQSCQLWWCFTKFTNLNSLWKFVDLQYLGAEMENLKNY